MKCPRCGQEASGRFCSHCGAALKQASCASCGAALSPGAKFCHACGTAVGGGAPAAAGGGGQARIVPWAIAGVAVVALIVVAATQFNRRPAAQAAPAATPGNEVATTDISQMTPREAADRLFDRVMRASEAGDTAQVRFFAPMTIEAYQRVTDIDGDARFHLGLIKETMGDYGGALAEADTIAKNTPNSLFVSVIRYEVARREGDNTAMAQARKAYLAHYTEEIKADRPGYADHAALLTQYHDQFQKAGG